MISSRTWVEISAEKLQQNVIALQSRLSPGVQTAAVVKSNAYGHGIQECGSVIESLVDWLAVDDIIEAVALRTANITKPIVVLGFVPESYYPQARELNITVTCACLTTFEWSHQYRVQTHLKLETGLGRQGFAASHIDTLLSMLPAKNEFVTGIYSHLAGAENIIDSDFTALQYRRFLDIAERIERCMGRPLLKHLSATAGFLMQPELVCDMVRIGLGMYGLYPSVDVQKTCCGAVVLQPVLEWKSVLSEVKQLPRGYTVGYDRTYVLSRNSVVGIVPVGYWHGLPRSVSNQGYMIVSGQRAPVVGRVSMDMTIVDLTDCGACSVGDTVTIIGGGVSAEDLAQSAGTINYEIVTRINPYIERRVV